MRERGYAVTIEELEPGLVAVAAPVFAGGTSSAGVAVAVAALSVSGPASRLAGGQLTAAAAACIAAAHSLSALLGHNPRTTQEEGAS